MTAKAELNEYLNQLVHEDFKLAQNSLAYSLNLNYRKSQKKKKQQADPKAHPERKKLTAAETKVLDYLPRKYMTFEEGLVMHREWLVYFKQLVDTNRLPPLDGNTLPNESVRQTMKKMFFYGAHVKVTQSVNKSLIGLEGIIVMDLMNTFKIVDKKNLIKVIPKKNSLLEFQAGKVTFSMYGSHICYRAANRIVKKTKAVKVLDYAKINGSEI